MQIFNALEFDPSQGSAKHPAGRHQVRIVDTQTIPGKGNGAMTVVLTYQSNVGRQSQRFNIVNPGQDQNEKISRQQLSAVCHATEVFNLNIAGNCRELLNKELILDIGDQASGDKLPDGTAKYSEVKCIYDIREQLPKARNGQTVHQNAAPAPNFAPSTPMPPQAAYNGMPGQPQGQVQQAPQAQPQYAPQPNPVYAQQPPQGFQQPMPPMGNGQASQPGFTAQPVGMPSATGQVPQYAPQGAVPFPMNGAPHFDQSAAPQPSWASPPR